MMFIVKPIYFNRPKMAAYRLYLVFDTDAHRYERVSSGQNVLVPNYAFKGENTVLNELRDHFKARGFTQSDWRLKAPSFLPYEELSIHLAGAEIVAS